MIQSLQRDIEILESKLMAIKNASGEEREQLINSLPLSSEERSDSENPFQSISVSSGDKRRGTISSNEEPDAEISNFVSVDESGTIGVYGLTSGLHAPSRSTSNSSAANLGAISHQLIANALLQRQQEYYMSSYDFDGVPPDLAIHLLDLHWNRQHHSFLLTYRPAIMRNLAQGGGPYCSKLLLNAIFGCVSKYSDRLELRSDPQNPATAGGRFFQRVKELLPSEMETPSIPLVVALLMVGSTLVSSGKQSTGWLYSGMAIRMVYDLGLHLDSRKSADLHRRTVEDLEIRRRVFWGAFICDKLQSLYLGRPATIQCRDAQVPPEFLDTSEEEELWSPYRDPKESNQSSALPKPIQFSAPTYSVSTFRSLALLSKIMIRVINKFYVIGATRYVSSMHKGHLLAIGADLAHWEVNLPEHLRFEVITNPCSTPNVMTLQAHYNCLIILLHRPFIADGHLRSSVGPTLTGSSWQKCTAAAQRLTLLVSAYRTHLTLRRAPYQIAYSVYVASTIHVRNAAQGNRESKDLLNFCLVCLKELSTPNAGATIPERVIRHLMRNMGVEEEEYQLAGLTPCLFFILPNLTIDIFQPQLSPWSNFDLDAIVKSFPETPFQMEMESSRNTPRTVETIGICPPAEGKWNCEDTDVLFGLMGSDFKDPRGYGCPYIPSTLQVERR
jgi:Fungal specific transcription factor domain